MACPLHYLDANLARYMDDLVKAAGTTVLVTTPNGAWAVPRHYIALHGLKASELPYLATVLGFARILTEGRARH